MSKESVVGIYATHTAAEAAVHKLQKAGFEVKTNSIMGNW